MERFQDEKTDYFFMQHALQLAERASSEDEVPIGAVVVNSDGKIIGSGYNQVEGMQSQLAHAELQAIKQATQNIGNWRLEGCTIYITIEPCVMCFALIKLSRVKRIVFGAASPRFGYQLDKVATSSVYRDIAISSGICENEAQSLLTEFFQKQRKKKGEYKSARSSKDQAVIDGSQR